MFHGYIIPHVATNCNSLFRFLFCNMLQHMI
nr:MAG TPA: hypothetical protein [Bacteriophage sp.]